MLNSSSFRKKDRTAEENRGSKENDGGFSWNNNNSKLAPARSAGVKEATLTFQHRMSHDQN